MHITDDVSSIDQCFRNDDLFPYSLTSIVIGDIDDVIESEFGVFAHVLFFESESSTTPLEQNLQNLKNSAWWSTGVYQDGYLNVYR